ncbi:DUF1793-domain-containing protein [Mycena rebaudengoi]|nr:DUF1793-domain-containing protein [Mycena rebaudengoi]
MRLLNFAATLFPVVHGAVTWTATPFNPPSFPLAVRTPYLSAWLPQGSGVALNDGWPTFWTGSALGWAGFVKVDGKAYSFLGASANVGTFTKATQKSSKFTATQSIFVLSAGPVDLTVTFLSPVEPNDLLKHSIPFSYLAVSAASTDGASHSVQVYTDISAEWVSGDNGLVVDWNSTTSGSILTHQVQLASQTVFGENGDHTQCKRAILPNTKIRLTQQQMGLLSTPYRMQTAGVTTYQTGSDVNVRTQFVNNGRLANTLDTGFRAINNNWPVFGLSRDLGSISAATAPVVFSVGHIRDPVINYVVAGGGLQARSPYFLSEFPTSASLISSFLGDFAAALTRANTFDAKVQTDASRFSANYAGVVALSIRQAFAATELTVSKNGNTFNTSDVLMFMKEISSNGNMNTVDVIFPAWPIYLYTNPTLGKYLLEALFRYQASGLYPNKWAIHDLGASYPRALGHNDGQDEKMPVEESGNMLIMALSYAQKSGDNSHLTRYAALLDQWTQFLITDGLIPELQLSTDDFAGHLANQTNLAIKGIIGIAAMGKIQEILGNTAAAQNYSSIATSYVKQWQTLSASSTGAHLTLAYNDANSWGLSYNLYSDKLLKLNLFPQSVYDMQTEWYRTHANAFGLPLDTRHTYTKTGAPPSVPSSIATTATVRNICIDAVKNFAADGKSDAPFSDWYDTISGSSVGFRARPVAGGHLALLVL